MRKGGAVFAGANSTPGTAPLRVGPSSMARDWRGLAIPLLGCLLALQPRESSAQSPALASTGELKQLTLDQLMNVEVTSVAREPQRLLQAAAAIQVITAEDIRRSGATSIPEALRLADNLEVAQINAHDWAISARGFNADLANKLLVLIDGRVVYTPLYGGVLWNVQDYLLEDIDRIEVISGPGGTLWGANAVNGVINIITKKASATQGLYATVAAGNQLQEQAGARLGAQLAPDTYLRVYGKYTDEGPQITSTGANADDSWHIARGGFRLDREAGVNQLTVQGDTYTGQETNVGTPDSELSGANVLGRWTHTGSDDAWLSLQAYYDHAYITQPYAALPPTPFFSGFPAASLTDSLDTYDLDFQDHLRWGMQKLTWGLGYRASREANYDLSRLRFAPPVLDQSLYSAFLQDEIELAPRLFLTAGSKLEHNDYTGYEAEPSVRLQWNMDPSDLLWGAVSRAVRTPSRYDRDLYAPSGLSGAPAPLEFPPLLLATNPDFVSETLIAYELGYRAALSSRLTGSLSTFYNDYHDLRSVTPTPTSAFYPYPYPVYFQNNLEGDTYGLELSVSYQLLDWWRLHAGYNLLRERLHLKPGAIDATGGNDDTADPQQQLSLRSSMDLPHDLSLDASLRWVDSFYIDDGPTGGAVAALVPDYLQLDMRLAWRVSHDLELSLTGQNLLHEYHVEYGFPSTTREQIVRSVFARITWGY